MYIIIGGGGKVGVSLAKKLLEKGHRVTVIERNREKCERMAEEIPSALVIHGDACDVKYLEEARIDVADVLAAVTGDDDDNLVMAQLAKEAYHVRRAVARVNDPRNERIFQALGIDALSSTTIITRLIEEETLIGDVITLQALKKGGLALVEMDLPDTAPVAGKKVEELKFPRGVVIVSILRNDEVIVPRGSTTLEGGDVVIALTTPEKEPALRDALFGKQAG